jgi:hypothetical protein
MKVVHEVVPHETTRAAKKKPLESSWNTLNRINDVGMYFYGAVYDLVNPGLFVWLSSTLIRKLASFIFTQIQFKFKKEFVPIVYSISYSY